VPLGKSAKTNLYFEARFRVRGKVLQAILCECEEEGDLRIRVARDPKRGWRYDREDAATYLDIHGFDPKGAYLKVRPGEWVEADVVCYGYLARSRTRSVGLADGNLLIDGARLVGQMVVDDAAVRVDFGLFQATLQAETAEELERALKAARLRDGDFVETACEVDVEVRRAAEERIILGRRRGRDSVEVA
jgi:hypothetical protein